MNRLGKGCARSGTRHTAARVRMISGVLGAMNLHGGAGYDQCFGGQDTDMFFNCEEVTQ
jgi:hypothetical protein